MKDNAAKALHEVELAKTKRNKLLAAENAKLAAEMKTLEARLSFETERANEAESHLNSRPTEDAAIRKFRASAEFREAVAEVAGREVVEAAVGIVSLKEEAALATAEISRLTKEASVAAAEVARLRKADAAAAEEILRLSAKLDEKKKELSSSKKVAKRRKRERKALEKLLAERNQVGTSEQAVTATAAVGGTAEDEIAADSCDDEEPDAEVAGSGGGQAAESVLGVEGVVAGIPSAGEMTVAVSTPVEKESTVVAAEVVEPLQSVRSSLGDAHLV